ncbi:Structural maintenance of chromosomes protein 5 [Astathelohania contejeani]|uniref:Structural maintenance of chromosomes protein 5 n=1 Tax=Astathelohania contejeani TaxID=164912 RepID=A0ABQ7HY41_9MICR|nr:Structural maintenance of chromosomes protein 5 [Thelohania contejeani]
MHKHYKLNSIISLKLKNFQTYKHAEFTFHPNLNFIAGPNGSGKSTIANAIAFVMGGSPKTVGKTKDISDYVKFGEMDGYIEAVVKHDNGIITIKRIIYRNQKRTNWFIDGRAAKQTEIDALLMRMKINVDSLCQFLPQEKVSHFAQLSPEELLDETIRSDEKIMIIKEELFELEQSREKIIDEVATVEKKKEGIEKLVSHLFKDVNKLREKEQSLKRVELFKLKKQWLEYDIIRKEYQRLKKKLNKNEEIIERKKQTIIELQKEIEEMRQSEETKTFDLKIAALNENNKKLSEIMKEIEDLYHEMDKVRVDECSLSKKKDNRNRIIENCKQELERNIDRLNGYHIPDPPIEPAGDNEVDMLEEQLSDLKREKERIQTNSIYLKNEIEALTKKKLKIKEMANRQLEFLKGYHRDTYNAVLWLRENKHMFKDEIIEPAILQITIKNNRFAPEIETFLSFQALSSFICKNPEDFEKFMKIMKDEKRWGVNGCEVIRGNVNSKPISTEELQKHGFEAYLIDLIESRKEILDVLAAYCNFNVIPVTKSNLDENIIFETLPFKKIAIRNKYLEIKRNKYNKTDYIIIESGLRKGNMFNQDLSKDEIKTIEKELYDKHKARETNKENYIALMKEIETNEEKLKGLYKERSDYKMKLNEIKRMEEKKEQLKNKIKMLELEILKMEDFSCFENEEKELADKFCLLTNKIANKIDLLTEKMFRGEYEILLGEAVDLESNIKEIQFMSNKLNNEIVVLEAELVDHKSELKKIKTQINAKKEILKEKTDKLSKNPLNEIDKAILEAMPGSIDALEKEIAVESTKATFYNVDPALMAEYNEKVDQLKEINISKNRLENVKFELDRKIEKMKCDLVEKIHSIVDPLNKRFGQLFGRLKCEGKIELVHNNLLSSKWKLNVLVKFRMEEELELLSSYRQSGGEKSVTTILFLLSLQGISPAPFRLVDEINQGMDRYNEKLVHDILVGLSEEESAPQFFIITPKIISGLRFGDKMKIIIVYSGDVDGVEKIHDKYKYNMIKA